MQPFVVGARCNDVLDSCRLAIEGLDAGDVRDRGRKQEEEKGSLL